MTGLLKCLTSLLIQVKIYTHSKTTIKLVKVEILEIVLNVL